MNAFLLKLLLGKLCSSVCILAQGKKVKHKWFNATYRKSVNVVEHLREERFSVLAYVHMSLLRCLVNVLSPSLPPPFLHSHAQEKKTFYSKIIRQYCGIIRFHEWWLNILF